MKTMNLMLGALAAGVTLGLLLAPNKGAETRKILSKMPENLMDSFKYRLYQLKDMFSMAKDETTDAAKKVVYKTHSLINEAKGSN
jgi:gas vesicle protein